MEYLPRSSCCLQDPIEWHPGRTNFDQSVCVYPKDLNPMVGSLLYDAWIDHPVVIGWDSTTYVSVRIPRKYHHLGILGDHPVIDPG